MVSLSSTRSEKVNPTNGPRQSIPERIAVRNQDQKVSERSLQTLNRQQPHFITMKERKHTSSTHQTTRTINGGWSVKTWLKCGIVVATTAGVYFGQKALGHFLGSRSWGSGPHSQYDDTQTDRVVMPAHQKETDVSVVAQQDQETIDRHLNHYGPIHRDRSFRERSYRAFREFAISDLEVSEKISRTESDLVEMHPSQVKQTKLPPQFLQVPTVLNPIPNQMIHSGEEFVVDLGNDPFFPYPERDVFNGYGQELRLTANLSNGDPLPEGLTLTPPDLHPDIDWIGSFNSRFAGIQKVILNDSIAFVINQYYFGFKVVDITNLSDPRIINDEVGNVGNVNSVFIDGTKVFVAGDTRFEILEMSDLLNPITMGSIFVGRDPFHRYYPFHPSYVTVEDSRAYVSGYSGFYILDITGLENLYDVPNHRRVISFISTTSKYPRIDVNGSTAFVADSGLKIVNISEIDSDNIKVVNISDLSDPAIISYVDTPGNSLDVVVKGSTAFVADGSGGLHIVNIADLFNPIIISTYNRSANRLIIHESKAFVIGGLGDGNRGTRFDIVDIADLSNPTVIKTVDFPGRYVQDITVDGTTAIALRGSEFSIYDLKYKGWQIRGRLFSDSKDSSYHITINATNENHRTVHTIFTLTVTALETPTSSERTNSSKWNYVGPLLGVGGFLSGIVGYCSYRKRCHQQELEENQRVNSSCGDLMMPERRGISSPSRSQEGLKESQSEGEDRRALTSNAR